RDLAQRPERVEFIEESSVHITLAGETAPALCRSATITFTHTPTESRAILLTIPGTNLDLTLTESGTLIAEGQALIPSRDFLQWAAEAELALADLSELHPVSGQSLAILYSLGLTPEDQIALSVAEENGVTRISLHLPPTRTLLPLRLETSPDLEPQSWQTLHTLPPGTTALPEISLPEGVAFLRLSVPPAESSL
ncbi:MAG: hypothetical protein Q7Q71_09785, partial [Verrucomicrobiota bacterium JB023]|nr:hypothetical protein [Verrucomicrobiota bacterium JB023]